MPLVDPKPEYPTIPRQPSVVITNKGYESVTNNTNLVDASNLLTHVEGSSYTVDYFSQIIARDSAVSGPMVNRDPIYQQYTRIQSMELKVTSPLTYVQDDVTKSIKGTGAASIYPVVIPNVGDVFVADIGAGNLGIFSITVSERKSIFNSTVHTVEYVLLETSANTDAYEERINDLENKTIERLVYVRDFLQHGQNPLLHMDEFRQVRELANNYYTLLERYFAMFVSNEYQTLIIPGQRVPIYDHFLTKAVMSFVNTQDSFNIRHVRLLNVQDDVVMNATCIWDVLKNKDLSLLKYSFRKVGLVTTKSFTQNPMLEGIYHSGIALTIYPIDPQVNVDHSPCSVIKPIYDDMLRDHPSPIRGLHDGPSQINDLNDLISDADFDGLARSQQPLIHKVLDDNYYVFSEAFYRRDREHLSVLEQCVMDYLENKAPNIRMLLLLTRTLHSWGGLERFYYFIVLMVLIKAAIRSI